MNGNQTAIRAAMIPLVKLAGLAGMVAGVYLLLAHYAVENNPPSATVAAQHRVSPYIPGMATAEAATQPETVYTAPALPPIELQSVAEMQNRIRAMLTRHEATRAARWNDIHQGNMRAAAAIVCYQSGQANCE